ncbi:hypothetical protein C8A05DRAFT_34493 [Staphylotrichum tortipilum]|uniref:LITAF domain-containing protein n=1 Tax=Staphylotrichum tortipilum TaxID=2831512 RepID=A0AAN6RTE0_9PEZI|nr:hypothetical protein C8A05DRAFT_34493 [Staphylotrichum longicolle]
MQPQQQQRQGPVLAAPIPEEIEPVAAVPPPAYSKQPVPTSPDAIQQEVNPVPVPVKDLPSDPAQVPKQLPMSPNGPQPQPAVGVTPLSRLGDNPQWIDCPFCEHRTMTRLRKEGTPMQMIAGIVCCLFCVCLACVPCLAHWFEETYYYCSRCNKQVAKRNEDGHITVIVPETVVPSKFA